MHPLATVLGSQVSPPTMEQSGTQTRALHLLPPCCFSVRSFHLSMNIRNLNLGPSRAPHTSIIKWLWLYRAKCPGFDSKGQMQNGIGAKKGKRPQSFLPHAARRVAAHRRAIQGLGKRELCALSLPLTFAPHSVHFAEHFHVVRLGALLFSPHVAVYPQG